jgi:adenylate cyclase
MYQWERRLRLATGLVLAFYVIQHLINHSLGIIGFEAMEAWRRVVSPIWDNLFVMLLLHGSLWTHFVLALMRLYRRRTLRMPAWELMQIGFGLSIAPLIAVHVIGTRVASELGGLDPDYYYIATIIAATPRIAVQMPVLLLVVWVHLVIGLHFWLRLKSWYRRTFPLWLVFAVSLPLLAQVGVLRAALTASEWLDDRDMMRDVFAGYGAMDAGHRSLLSSLEMPVLLAMLGILLAVLAARQVRAWIVRRAGDVRISHANGRTVLARRGQTLLEALRAANIPHTSVCGGRARCTTCRVRVGTGREYLPVPGALEQAALARIGADDTVRLACQARPMVDVAITPLVTPAGVSEKALSIGGVQGNERQVVCMFVDMRESTRIGERILPYDVVFILNQFFIELSDSLRATGGHYAQFSGDGLMALYGLETLDMPRAAREAVNGAAEMFRRLAVLNTRVYAEFGITLGMGIGIHSGAAIVGRMGPPQSPLLTAIGDNINIAARLESASKVHGCDVVVSTETLDHLGPDRHGLGIRTIEVRGRVNGIEVALIKQDDLPGLVERLVSQTSTARAVVAE